MDMVKNALFYGKEIIHKKIKDIQRKKEKRKRPGFHEEDQARRRQLRWKASSPEGPLGMRAEREGSLAWNHYARLTEIAPADVLLAHFSLEDVSRKVLQRFTHRGSQPTELLPKYTDILCGKGLLRVPAGHRGRKAPAHAQETCLTSQENAFSSQDWAD